METLLLGKLNNLSTKLNTLFGERYKKQQEEFYKSLTPLTPSSHPVYSSSSGSSYYTAPQSSQPVVQNITQIYHKAPSLPILPIYAYPPSSQPQTVIINNPSSTIRQQTTPKKEEEEEDNTIKQIVAVGGGMGLAGYATWLFANDEYVNYGLSQVENEFNDLCKLIPKEYEFNQQLNAFACSFIKWKDIYIAETKPKFYGKVTSVASGFAGLGGLFVGSTLLIVGGLAGVTLGGCYWLWRTLTDKYNNESSEYNNMMTHLNNVTALLSQRRFVSSAPPQEPAPPQDLVQSSQPSLSSAGPGSYNAYPTIPVQISGQYNYQY